MRGRSLDSRSAAARCILHWVRYPSGVPVGAGTNYSFGPRWAVRGDFRELAAFPSKDTDGLANGSKADPIWMERGAIGLGYRF